MLTSYHVHTTFSDGESSVREMLRGAVAAGLDELGFSDHLVLVGSGPTPDWSMSLGVLLHYVEAVRAAAAEAEGKLVVRLGIEADFVPETADRLAQVLRQHPFDYVIGGVHILDGFMVDERAENWARLSEAERNEMARRYWDRVRALAESRLLDIIAHIDVYKKFAILPTVDLSPEISDALDAIAAAGMAVEVNCAGWYWDIKEAYPSPGIIAECRKRDIPMLVTADAHRAQDLTRSFDRGFQLLRHAGYAEQAVFAGREMRLVAM